MITNSKKERIIMNTTFRQFFVYMVLLVGLILVPVGVSAADNEVGVSVSYSTVNEEGFDNGFGFGINYTRAIMPNEVNDDFDVSGLDCSYSGSLYLKDAFGFHLGVDAYYPINHNFALTLGLE